MSDRPIPDCPRCGFDQSGQVATWREACPLEGVCTECGLLLRWGLVVGRMRPTRWSLVPLPIALGGWALVRDLAYTAYAREPARRIRGQPRVG